MTNFEITYNLFKTLNKYEQKEIVKQYIDGIFDENVHEYLQKFESNSRNKKIFEQSSQINLNYEKICTNFFEAIEQCDAIIRTDNIGEVNELYTLFTNSIPEDVKYAQSAMERIDLITAGYLGFYIDEYSFDFRHYSYYENDYRIISFKNFKKLLKFEPKL